MYLIEITPWIFNTPALEVGKQYLAEQYVGGCFLVEGDKIAFNEEVKVIGKFTEKLNFKYKGEDAVDVLMFKFYNRDSYIISTSQFIRLGGMNHIYIDNEIEEIEIKEIVRGSMSQSQFNELQAWEG